MTGIGAALEEGWGGITPAWDAIATLATLAAFALIGAGTVVWWLYGLAA